MNESSTMSLLDDQIKRLRSFLEEASTSATVYDRQVSAATPWPVGRKGSIVMQSETAIELGHPETESTAFHLWTQTPGTINNGRVTLIGPGLNDAPNGKLPFGKVILLEVDGFTDENSYARHRDLERTRFDLNLSGYMMRAVSQAGREWSRISFEAIIQGFSLATLGYELIGAYRNNPYVRAVEVALVTSSVEDVSKLKTIAVQSERLIQAMNKMTSELSFDCGSCDYSDVCSEVEGLRAMRQNLKDR
jgi:CO dehydrogenase/acetyl-CoA synthase beta subunit